jgi:hypothetical protein
MNNVISLGKKAPKTYKLVVEWTIQKEVLVEAESFEEAELKALEEIPPDGFFSRLFTMESENE